MKKYRVKDGIDLSIFEQMGFKKEFMTYGEADEHWADYYVRNAGFKIETYFGEREQEIIFFDFFDERKEGYNDNVVFHWNWCSDEDITQYIQDLISANLVEEIEEFEEIEEIE